MGVRGRCASRRDEEPGRRCLYTKSQIETQAHLCTEGSRQVGVANVRAALRVVGVCRSGSWRAGIQALEPRAGVTQADRDKSTALLIGLLSVVGLVSR
jgi:hypothetical protein